MSNPQEETTTVSKKPEVEGDTEVFTTAPTKRPEVEADESTGDNFNVDLLKAILGISGFCAGGLVLYGMIKRR